MDTLRTLYFDGAAEPTNPGLGSWGWCLLSQSDKVIAEGKGIAGQNVTNNVAILRSCGIDLCEKIEDRAGTVIYADPPYLVKGAKYLHDFVDADHERLAQALCRFKQTRVAVSYYEHPRLAELYPGWHKMACPTAKALVNSGMRDGNGRTEAPEVLLVNRHDGTRDLFSGDGRA